MCQIFVAILVGVCSKAISIYIMERLADFRDEVTGGRSSAIAYWAEEERAKRGGWKELWRDGKEWGFGEFVGWIG